MKFFILALFLLTTSAVFSEDTTIKNTNSENSENKTSLENRRPLKFQAAVTIVGAEYTGHRSNFSLSLGYLINEQNSIFVRYTFQNDSGSIEAPKSTNDYPKKLRAIAFGDRYFIGNSFNVSGLGYWRESFKYDPAKSLTYLIKDYGLGARIGNEWQWTNFTMGCDWFGLNQALIKIKNTFPEISFGSDGSTSIAFLNFYLGYSF